MLPLKIALLWHQHQPDYRMKDEFLLPWTRLHAVKDYYDLPALLREFPDIKQNFNLAPSLMLQLDDYLLGGWRDVAQRLTEFPAESLSRENKYDILERFFLLNWDNMLYPYPRYTELLNDSRDPEVAIARFSAQDWRDLQTWYNLAWIGMLSRKRPEIDALFKKGKNFTEEEKKLVLATHLDIISKVMPEMLEARERGQIELSFSPLYHPILPLLISSRAGGEALADFAMPEPPFEFPEDAREQIRRGMSYFESRVGEKPCGCWPSEGSISDDALDLLAESGVCWAASDEQVLFESLPPGYKTSDKYFPRIYKTKSGREISLFFRDHSISDRIGFVYSSWEPHYAAEDFYRTLEDVRRRIIADYGEKSLESAVLPVILDGENCWEFYKENGLPFLRRLYTLLDASKSLKTVTMSEAIHSPRPDFLPELKHIRAGSWINANFSIWIGSPEDRRAWEELAKARQLFEQKKNELPETVRKATYEELLIAEGSDWFWWYGPEHHAPNKPQFDEMFRWRLAQIYLYMGLEPPHTLERSLDLAEERLAFRNPIGKIIFNANDPGREEHWENAGFFDPAALASSMHRVGEALKLFKIGIDDSWLVMRIDVADDFTGEDEIQVISVEPKMMRVTITGADAICYENTTYIRRIVSHVHGKRFVVAFSKEGALPASDSITLTIKTRMKNSEIQYKNQTFKFNSNNETH